MSIKVTLNSTQLDTLYALILLERRSLIAKLQQMIEGEQFTDAKKAIEHVAHVTTLRDVLEDAFKAARVTPIDPPATVARVANPWTRPSTEPMTPADPHRPLSDAEVVRAARGVGMDRD